jgi:hypothetical protein
MGTPPRGRTAGTWAPPRADGRRVHGQNFLQTGSVCESGVKTQLFFWCHFFPRDEPENFFFVLGKIFFFLGRKFRLWMKNLFTPKTCGNGKIQSNLMFSSAVVIKSGHIFSDFSAEPRCIFGVFSLEIGLVFGDFTAKRICILDGCTKHLALRASPPTKHLALRASQSTAATKPTKHLALRTS